MATNLMLETFDPAVESVDDYRERFDFYYTAAGVCQDRLKELFLAIVGREVFSKVKTLASPRPLTELELPQIVDIMKEHYKKDTIEIAERFKLYRKNRRLLPIILQNSGRTVTSEIIWTLPCVTNWCVD